jgi:hypothetical protein
VEITLFTLEQATRLLKAAMGHRLEALFTVGLATGLRSGECSALRWPDVDLEAGSVTVRHTLQRVKQPGEKKGRLMLLPPKSKKSRWNRTTGDMRCSFARAPESSLSEAQLACNLLIFWSHPPGSNRRPADYELTVPPSTVCSLVYYQPFRIVLRCLRLP